MRMPTQWLNRLILPETVFNRNVDSSWKFAYAFKKKIIPKIRT